VRIWIRTHKSDHHPLGAMTDVTSSPRSWWRPSPVPSAIKGQSSFAREGQPGSLSSIHGKPILVVPEKVLLRGAMHRKTLANM
jgi:hypothetical protein